MHPILTGSTLDLSPVRAGSVVTLTHPSGRETEHRVEDGPVTLPEPGTYGVGIRPPPGEEPDASRPYASRAVTLLAPYEDRVEASRRNAEQAFVDHLSALARGFEGVIPAFERATWAAKDQALAQGAAMSALARRMIEIEAALRGESTTATEAAMKATRDAFYVVGPALSGERRRFVARLRAASSFVAVEREAELARRRVALVLSGLSALAADPLGFAAQLPQEPEAA